MRQGQPLQRVHDPRSHPHPLVTVQEERPEIAQLGWWHPDRWKPICCQQVQQQGGVSAIVLLTTGFGLPNSRRVTDAGR